MLRPDTVFLAPRNILHRDIAEEFGVKIVGRNTGHPWEQVDLPLYLAGKGLPPLFNPANTGPMLYGNNFTTIHDLAFYHHPEWNSKKFSTWYNILIPRLAIGSRHIFTVSNTMRDEIAKYYKISPSKISVTYNGIAQHMFAEGSQTPVRKEKIILSVGTFNKRKNHQSLVRAFLQTKIKDEYQLVMVGDRNKVFRESGLDDKDLAAGNVSVYEHFTNEELIAMYRKAEVIVSLSVYEGFGVPVLEGIYYGCKAICSDIPVYRELYDGCSVFCDPVNLEEIVAALEKAAQTKWSDRTCSETLPEKYDYRRSAEMIVDKIEANPR